MSDKFLVIGEAKDGELRNVTFEAIAAAKKINEDSEVVGVLCGSEGLEELGNQMIQHGADRVVTVVHSNLETYTSEGYSQAILAVAEEENPAGIIMGHTAIGKDVTPIIASKLESGLVSDAVEIEKDGDQVVFTRPIYSGKAFEKKVIKDGIVFATIRPNNISLLEKDESRSGEVQTKEVDIKDLRTIIKEVIRKTSEGVDMSEANVVIAGGRGVRGPEGFDPLYELADILGGAVGASRGACDADYCDYSLQIGQTGKVVTP
ncbi:MAG TPA: electron transfer flavoprotein subunit alpha/FixB family protein, partial [Bacillota bacterium]|nr:electron transfer flavoprotein subunit alpha/FixB family protein [Bacillota bacterium]